MLLNSIGVALGGCLGAMARFGMSHLINGRFQGMFPLATCCINILGSFLLGVITGASFAPFFLVVAGTGFMGAFTTFSTCKWESYTLFTKKRNQLGVVYLFVSYSLGISSAALGMFVGVHL
ncbi:chromosome condensation protein CrcB [Brevibacillus laterosporus]|uniref:Fluoride-specific ion channel FluC n=1 Tax=Brevibacillus laterosporus TaxID=1465 RepID=A0A502H558_BRELA|nr:CrcB family protein [Brevibacillus laterosporus]QDX94805.1 chromosome condensation protein CrcB [Brevibacillus laterosporus]TPG68503.1 chromosome condensation protein CrcB [Brevibacillus laterosporus]TPG82530.1 chromosome condensation protein CrcB [Brevibacillus laterosporus]